MSRKRHSLTERVSMGGQALFSCLAGNGIKMTWQPEVQEIRDKKLEKMAADWYERMDIVRWLYSAFRLDFVSLKISFRLWNGCFYL